MVECEDCGEEVPEVWRYRELSEPTTHRDVRWFCRGCHPSVAGSNRERSESHTAVADGGVPMLGCPMCGGSTIDGQRLSACTECSWSGPRDR